MLAARGVSLGLGKIKLNELPYNDKVALSRLQRAKSSKKNAEPKIYIKKHVDRKDDFWGEMPFPRTVDSRSPTLSSSSLKSVVVCASADDREPPLMRVKKETSALSDKRDLAEAYFATTYYAENQKTLWIACRAVFGGVAIMILGLMMTVLAYFERELSTTSMFNATTGENYTAMDSSLRFKLKSMQYIGPVMMGCGMFMLICACVITLESRDRHTQIIQETRRETSDQLKTALSQKQQETRKERPTKKSLSKLNAPLIKEMPVERAAKSDTGLSSDTFKADSRSADTRRVVVKKGLKYQPASSSLSDNTSAFASTLPLQSSVDLSSTIYSNEHEVKEYPSTRRVGLPLRQLTPESRVNRPSPKGQAPIVKVESLSTSLMTSPSNSPRVQEDS